MDNRKVFISYARPDKDWADWLGAQLADHGFPVWTDATSVPAGESFIAELNRTIEKSDLVLAVLSPDYFQSRWCQHETAVAATSKVPIIPVLIKPCEVSGFLHYYNWADLTADRDRGLHAVIDAAEHLTQSTV